MNFDINDIFETHHNDNLYRVFAVIHDDKKLYSIDENGDEVEFDFADVAQLWKAT